MTRELRAWLRAHPEAWHGWPTHRILDRDEAKRLTERLRHHGCFYPVEVFGLDAVVDAVALLRAERHDRYVHQIEAAL